MPITNAASPFTIPLSTRTPAPAVTKGPDAPPVGVGTTAGGSVAAPDAPPSVGQGHGSIGKLVLGSTPMPADLGGTAARLDAAIAVLTAGGGKAGVGSLANLIALVLRRAEGGIAHPAAGTPGSVGHLIGSSGGSGGHLGQTIGATPIGGGATGGESQASIAKTEADQKADAAAAAAEDAEAQADLKQALVGSMKDMITQLLEAVKEIQEAKSERMATFTRV